MSSLQPTTVVTGGSRGIGRAIALRLASEGHDLVLAAADAPITGIVANAGAIRATGRLVDLDPADIDSADIEADLRVDLLGTILTCQAAIPALAETRGAIVTIGSGAVSSGSPGTYVHYAAAKAGVAVFTEGLARELAPQGIRVNCVEPGTVWTDFHLDPERPAKVAERIPLGRAGYPEEIAGAVAWLLSGDAAYATGATIRVAGGL